MTLQDLARQKTLKSITVRLMRLTSLRLCQRLEARLKSTHKNEILEVKPREFLQKNRLYYHFKDSKSGSFFNYSVLLFCAKYARPLISRLRKEEEQPVLRA